MRFKRFLLLQNGLDHPGGHWLPETKSLKEAVIQAGMQWHCFANSRLDKNLAAQLNVDPVVPFLHGNILAGNDPQTRLASFMMAAEALPATLHRHYPGSPSSHDLLHVGWTTDLEIIGIARWLESIPLGSRPAISFFLHRPPGDWNVDPTTLSVSGDFHRWHYAISRLKRAQPRVTFSSLDPILSTLLSQILSIPVLFLPVIQGNAAAGSSAYPNPSFDLGIFGASRPEQGIRRLPEILERLRQRHPSLKSYIQILGREHESFLRPRIHPSWLDTNVSLSVGHLEKQAQLDRMADCKLLLLPYDPKVYCLTASAIFTDALSLGLPVVVPSLTSMGRMILSGTATGMVYQSNDAGSVADIVLKSLNNWGNLRTRAMDLSKGFKERHSAAYIIKEVCSAFARKDSR